jgi:hypothetical protein
VKRLPETHVEVYLHPGLLRMKRVGQLDPDCFRADDRRRTTLPREEEGESRAQAFFLWPQKNCHHRSSKKRGRAAAIAFRAAPPTNYRAPAASELSPLSIVQAGPLDPSPMRWFIASLHSL